MSSAIIGALVGSAFLFLLYILVLVSPILRDKTVVAPYTTQQASALPQKPSGFFSRWFTHRIPARQAIHRDRRSLRPPPLPTREYKPTDIEASPLSSPTRTFHSPRRNSAANSFLSVAPSLGAGGLPRRGARLSSSPLTHSTSLLSPPAPAYTAQSSPSPEYTPSLIGSYPGSFNAALVSSSTSSMVPGVHDQERYQPGPGRPGSQMNLMGLSLNSSHHLLAPSQSHYTRPRSSSSAYSYSQSTRPSTRDSHLQVPPSSLRPGSIGPAKPTGSGYPTSTSNFSPSPSASNAVAVISAQLASPDTSLPPAPTYRTLPSSGSHESQNNADLLTVPSASYGPSRRSPSAPGGMGGGARQAPQRSVSGQSTQSTNADSASIYSVPSAFSPDMHTPATSLPPSSSASSVRSSKSVSHPTPNQETLQKTKHNPQANDFPHPPPLTLPHSSSYPNLPNAYPTPTSTPRPSSSSSSSSRHARSHSKNKLHKTHPHRSLHSYSSTPARMSTSSSSPPSPPRHQSSSSMSSSTMRPVLLPGPARTPTLALVPPGPGLTPSLSLGSANESFGSAGSLGMSDFIAHGLGLGFSLDDTPNSTHATRPESSHQRVVADASWAGLGGPQPPKLGQLGLGPGLGLEFAPPTRISSSATGLGSSHTKVYDPSSQASSSPSAPATDMGPPMGLSASQSYPTSASPQVLQAHNFPGQSSRPMSHGGSGMYVNAHQRPMEPKTNMHSHSQTVSGGNGGAGRGNVVSSRRGSVGPISTTIPRPPSWTVHPVPIPFPGSGRPTENHRPIASGQSFSPQHPYAPQAPPKAYRDSMRSGGRKRYLAEDAAVDAGMIGRAVPVAF